MLQQAIAGFFALLTACSLIAIQTAAQVTALPVPAPASSTYATCAGESAIDRASLTALQPEFDRIAALQDKPALADYLAHSHLLGDDAFFHFGTVQDPQEPSRSLPILSQSGLGLPQPEDYLSLASSDQQRRNQYVTHIAHSLALTGETPAQAQADAATILQLETAMARVSLGSQDLRDPARTYHLMPRGDLRKLAPTLDWNAFLSTYGLSAVPYFDIAEPEFLLGLNTILKHEDMPQIRAYLRWHWLLRSYKCVRQ